MFLPSFLPHPFLALLSCLAKVITDVAQSIASCTLGQHCHPPFLVLLLPSFSGQGDHRRAAGRPAHQALRAGGGGGSPGAAPMFRRCGRHHRQLHQYRWRMDRAVTRAAERRLGWNGWNTRWLAARPWGDTAPPYIHACVILTAHVVKKNETREIQIRSWHPPKGLVAVVAAVAEPAAQIRPQNGVSRKSAVEEVQ